MQSIIILITNFNLAELGNSIEAFDNFNRNDWFPFIFNVFRSFGFYPVLFFFSILYACFALLFSIHLPIFDQIPTKMYKKFLLFECKILFLIRNFEYGFFVGLYSTVVNLLIRTDFMAKWNDVLTYKQTKYLDFNLSV